MCKGMTFAIKIVYVVQNRYECAYVSEFFKMCGFLVLEEDISDEIMELRPYMKDDKWYDEILFLGVSKRAYESLKNSRPQKVHWVESKLDFLENFKSDNVLYLQKYLANIVEDVLHYPGNEIDRLIGIYVSEKYCRISYIKRYFGKAVDDIQKKNIYKTLLEMVRYLESEEKKINDKRVLGYYSHAKFLCARKANDLCEYLGMDYYYNPKKMIEKCLAIRQYLSAFPAASILAASFATSNAAFRDYVIPFYENALEGQEDNPAYANVYYRMGRYYQEHLSDILRANNAYNKACDVAPEYFRALFKKGNEYLDQKRYMSAVKEYQSLIDVLDRKREKGQMFPVEFEYMCKSYLLIALIHDVYWRNPGERNVYERNAYLLIEREMTKSHFFKNFLGDREEIYIKYLRKRIKLKRHIMIGKYRNYSV